MTPALRRNTLLAALAGLVVLTGCKTEERADPSPNDAISREDSSDPLVRLAAIDELSAPGGDAAEAVAIIEAGIKKLADEGH